MAKLIPRLTNPAAFGADPADSFDVVVPSIPGYGFSDRPSSKGFWHKRVASMFAALMDGLGYTKYGAHGGDWGSSITEQIAFHYSGSLLGIHLTDVPFWHMLRPPSGLTRSEEKYLEEGKAWQMEEGAYALLQATKPQTLAFAINDSPAGLAAWIIEKFRTWSDCHGDVESKFTKDELLNQVMIYWVSQTSGSSARLYYEAKNNWPMFTPSRVKTPTAFAMFPKDIVPAPREFAERLFNVEQWDSMPRGGHFAALEEPDLLADSIRKFYRQFR